MGEPDGLVKIISDAKNRRTGSDVISVVLMPHLVQKSPNLNADATRCLSLSVPAVHAHPTLGEKWLWP